MADAKIIELDTKTRKISLSPKAAQIDEEKSLVAKFGEGAKNRAQHLKAFLKALSGRKKKNNRIILLVKSDIIKGLKKNTQI